MKKILIVLLFMMCIITGCNNEEKPTYSTINIDKYYENIDEYVNEYVMIKGFWNNGKVSEFMNENSIYLNLSNDLLYDLNSKLIYKQTIHVYGKMSLEDNNYIFKTDKVMHYDNTLSERTWDYSNIIDSGQAVADMITGDISNYYEFTGTVLTNEENTSNIMIDGIGFIVTVSGIKVPAGDTLRVLITDFKYDYNNDKWVATAKDYKLLDGEEIYNG